MEKHFSSNPTLGINLQIQDFFVMLSQLVMVMLPFLVVCFVLAIIPEIIYFVFRFLGRSLGFETKKKNVKKDYKTWREPRKKKPYSKLRTGHTRLPASQRPRVKQNKDGSAWVKGKNLGEILIPADKKPWVYQNKDFAYVYIPPKSKRKNAILWTEGRCKK